MSTREAEDSRPNCKCHGEPMVRNSYQRNGNIKWGCGRKRREYGRRAYHERGQKEYKAALYARRKAEGVCVRCAGPVLSEVLCWDCLNYMEGKSAFRI